MRAVAERVLLVGMMGAGKSTVGPLVARRLGWSFVDTDDLVERSTGRTVPELFASGQALFRAEESRALEAALAGASPVVVSVGGGAVVDPHNRALLSRAGLVVWLRASPETLARRVGSGTGRPLLSGSTDPLEPLARIEAERRPLFAEVATEVVDVDGVPVKAAAELVVALAKRALGRAPLPDGNTRA